MSVPPPSPSSLAHRESIARLITPLRRIRPTIVYYKLAAHRIPTLWTLYRGLQKHAERKNVKWRIRTLFEAKRHTIQAHVTKAQLERAHQWLDKFVRAKQGDAHLQAVLDRYDRMIAGKRERREFGRLVREALEEQARLRTRTIFKGSFFRPTFYNRLLPREQRYKQSIELTGWIKDLEMESAFEKRLRHLGERVDPVFSDDPNAWLRPLRDKLRIIYKANENDYDRLYSDYPPSLLLRGVRARREKNLRKTRQYARERAGELFPSTLARMRQGPPAHVLAKMTPEQRRVDKIVRGASEGGYTAAVKMSVGRTLKDKVSWRMEDGKEPENLEGLEDEIRNENRRRRTMSLEDMKERIASGG